MGPATVLIQDPYVCNLPYYTLPYHSRNNYTIMYHNYFTMGILMFMCLSLCELWSIFLVDHKDMDPI